MLTLAFNPNLFSNKFKYSESELYSIKALSLNSSISLDVKLSLDKFKVS